MKKFSFCFLIKVLGAVTLCGSASFAAEVPSQIFSINNVTVGVTTIDEVRTTYGMIEPSRVSREEEADVTLCYSNSLSGRDAFIVFESGVMGSYKFITGFRISSIRPSGNCMPTDINVGTLSTENGVRLGQSFESFEKVVPIEFKRCGLELTYETVSQRAATQEELKRLRANWPNAKQDYFDVTTVIKAIFQDNKLMDLYVHKIESY